MSDFIGGIFTQLWRVFSVESPILGLTFGQIWLGIFVVGIASSILKQVFGLLGSAKNDFSSAGRAMIKKYKAKNSRDNNK